jgi:hypothetical protein
LLHFPYNENLVKFGNICVKEDILANCLLAMIRKFSTWWNRDVDSKLSSSSCAYRKSSNNFVIAGNFERNAIIVGKYRFFDII